MSNDLILMQQREGRQQDSVTTVPVNSVDSCVLDKSDIEYHWCEDDDLSEATGGQSYSSEGRSCSEESPLTNEVSVIGSDPSYVELVTKIDTNLAHIDMEDFKSEDIHSLLVDYSHSQSQSQSSQVSHFYLRWLIRSFIDSLIRPTNSTFHGGNFPRCNATRAAIET